MDAKRLPFCHQKFVAQTDTKGETSKLAFSDSRAPESLLFILQRVEKQKMLPSRQAVSLITYEKLSEKG